MQKRKSYSENVPTTANGNITAANTMLTFDISNKHILIIDTETTGLCFTRGCTSSNYKNWDTARLVQVAWEMYNAYERKERIIQKSHIIKPDGFEIPEVVVNIHGISTERAHAEGVPLNYFLKNLYTLLEHKPIIVAHNMQFDSDIILAELYRAQAAATLNGPDPDTDIDHAKITEMISMWNACEKHCTMLMGTLPGQRWPKLAALYERCFHRPPEGEMHRADNDVRACTDIYFYLMKTEFTHN
jgi:DNA polymerase-3 subunit alpha